MENGDMCVKVLSEPVTWFDIRVFGYHGCVNFADFVFYTFCLHRSGGSMIHSSKGGRGGGGKLWWLQLRMVYKFILFFFLSDFDRESFGVGKR